MPKEDWFVARWKLFDLIISQIRWFFSHPGSYIKVLIIALRFCSIAEFSLATYFALKVKKQKIERIHCHLGDRKLYTGYFCKLLLKDIFLSVTIHAHELYINPNWKLFPIALNACDKIVCIADLNRRILKQKWGIPEEKLHVIRLFGFSGKQEINPSIILCVGRFERKKGHDVLLKAISQLVREDFNIEVWLAGCPEPGSKGVDVMGYAKKLGIENRVVSFGEVGEKVLKVLYRECDIFCLLSRHDDRGVPEGIPVVLMEAMSMGKPVIATRTGATDELVEEILIEEESSNEALDSIRKLLNDPELCRFLGKKNQEIVKTAYSEKNAIELFKILKSN
jgi:glycosyltransferase involved in cell wall biosynthesis